MISFDEINEVLKHTDTPDSQLQINLGNQRVLIPKRGTEYLHGEMKMSRTRIVFNVRKHPDTKRWIGYINLRSEKVMVRFDAVAPRGFWKTIDHTAPEYRPKK